MDMKQSSETSSYREVTSECFCISQSSSPAVLTLTEDVRRKMQKMKTFDSVQPLRTGL